MIFSYEDQGFQLILLYFETCTSILAHSLLLSKSLPKRFRYPNSVPA